MPIYAFIDVLVVPKPLLEKYGKEMTVKGRLSITKPKTQQVLRTQIDELFKRFPSLTGLVIRFGETYLHDTPYHKGNRPAHSPEDHTILINLLREEVCVKRKKMLFYRTWDFGHFHTRPSFYLAATNPVPPHSNLLFSIKHTNSDFLRGVGLNQTLGIGKHNQIIEVSANQAGCYGKNSHPYYIGQGVLEGWEELGAKRKGILSLRDNPRIKGLWTWSAGDGWEGPYITNEFWVNLNTYVIAQYAQHPWKTEKELFQNYATTVLKLSPKDCVKFRELCLLATSAVFQPAIESRPHFPMVVSRPIPHWPESLSRRETKQSRRRAERKSPSRRRLEAYRSAGPRNQTHQCRRSRILGGLSDLWPDQIRHH